MAYTDPGASYYEDRYRQSLTDAVAGLAPDSGLMAAACAALGVSRASVQRRRTRLAAPAALLRPRSRPARALSKAQQQVVLDLLHAPRFADQAPAEIYACLLDEATVFTHLVIHNKSREL